VSVIPSLTPGGPPLVLAYSFERSILAVAVVVTLVGVTTVVVLGPPVSVILSLAPGSPPLVLTIAIERSTVTVAVVVFHMIDVTAIISVEEVVSLSQYSQSSSEIDECASGSNVGMAAGDEALVALSLVFEDWLPATTDTRKSTTSPSIPGLMPDAALRREVGMEQKVVVW